MEQRLRLVRLVPDAVGGGTLLDHVVVVNYSAGVPLAVVLEEIARALRNEDGMDVHGMIYAR
jgi:hypothetical protein